MDSKPMRVVSGIQPTGNLHLGNYLGAIRRWAGMQDEAECFIFLADLHAVTVYNDPALLAANIREMAAALIACGVDPQRVTLFNHARVPAHAEMAWLLACVARIGWLNRMTQFKEKSGKNAKARAWAFTPIRCCRRPTCCCTRPPTCRSARTRSSISS
jgi:tryptophanyl-tRNA synthetase